MADQGKVILVSDISCLFSTGTIGAHRGARDSTLLSLKMVSTHSRAGVNKQVEAGPSGPTNITPDLAVILDSQAKMQLELVDLKKRNADEMEALRQENSRLRRKIEADPTQKGKAKETSDVAGSPAFQPTKEESEYNPTPHTFTTTQQTPILSTHPTHFHSTLPGNTTAPTPAATLLTTHIPPYNMPITLHTTHITATDHTVTAALVQDVSGTQHPIYFVSRTLQDPKTRYQMVEKLGLSLVHAARLRPYFQNHNIIVKTDYPIQKILQKPDLAGRMLSWAVELFEFNIHYKLDGPIKAQCLLDFVNDLQQTPEKDQWTLYVDGSSILKGAGVGIVLEGPNDILIEKSLHFAFKTSNNQAEYEAILASLSLAREVGVKSLTCKIDSKSKTLPSYNITIWSGQSSSAPSNKSASTTFPDPKTLEPTYYPN